MHINHKGLEDLIGIWTTISSSRWPGGHIAGRDNNNSISRRDDEARGTLKKGSCGGCSISCIHIYCRGYSNGDHLRSGEHWVLGICYFHMVWGKTRDCVTRDLGLPT